MTSNEQMHEWHSIVGATIRGMLGCLGPPPRQEVIDTYVRLLEGQHPRDVVAGCDRLLETWEGSWPPAPAVVIRAVEKAAVRLAREKLLASSGGDALAGDEPCFVCWDQGTVTCWAPATMRRAAEIVSEGSDREKLMLLKASVPCTCRKGDAWAIQVRPDGTLVSLGRFAPPCIRVVSPVRLSVDELWAWAEKYVSYHAGKKTNEEEP